MEHQHARPRQQRGVEFERGIFGGGADQHHGAVFHHRQKRILLRAVEAMHLVDEQQRALAHLAPGARRVEHLLQIGDAGKHRGNLLEMQFGGIGQQPRHRGLAGARRSPEDQRAQRARRQHPRQRAVGPEDMILSDHIRQRARAQPVRQRTRRILLHPCGSEQVGSFAWALRAHPPSVTLICWPPRTTMMRQSRAVSRVAFSRSLVLAIFWLLTARMMSPFWKPTLAAVRAVGEIGHHDAFGVGIEPQFVGDRRRDVGDLGALERRARRQDDLVAAGVGRGLQRHRQLDGLAGALHVDLRGAAERTGGEAIVEARWDRRRSGRRSRRSGRTVSARPAPPGCSP